MDMKTHHYHTKKLHQLKLTKKQIKNKIKMLGKKREKSKSKISKNDKFIYKLYDILRTPKYEKIIHWGQDGKTIVVSSINKLSKKT